jgi:hypothetical protein
MNSEEQTLIDGLFSRLQQAEKESAPRDAQAEARIKEHLANQPAAGYFMAQAILVQEAAIKRLDEQNKQLAQQVEQLQAELQQARNPASLEYFWWRQPRFASCKYTSAQRWRLA